MRRAGWGLLVVAIGSVATVASGQIVGSDEVAIAHQAAVRLLEDNPQLEHAPGWILVRFRPDAPAEWRDAARLLVGGRTLQRLGLVPDLELLHVEVEAALAVKLLGADPSVVYAELDFVVQPVATPNDTYFNLLWGLNNTGQTVNGDPGTADADIDAPEAWNVFTGAPAFVIADIDTGTQMNHPDLAANIWTNPGEIAGNGIDDDGNGYIDDLHGWDFYDHDNNPSDPSGHGTHTAGTIGAVGNNGIGVTGVNWNCRIASLRFLGPSGGYTSDAVLAVQYCTQKGIKVSNNSWGGGGYSQSLYDAINASKSVGHIFVAAAGNSNVNTDTSPHYPSSYNLDNLISVAATDNDDKRASFSNYGPTSVDLGAPGVNILSTYPTNNYAYLNGTSMATPHVTGVVALVYALNPTWTYPQVRSRIFSTVRPVSALAGITVTGGVLNAAAALGGGGGNTPPVVTITAPANNSTVLQGTPVQFAGSAIDAEDGNLSANLVWTSSLQGQIGTGASFTRSDLVTGTHTITASVTDSGGLSGSAFITLNVQSQGSAPNAPSNATAINLGGGKARVQWTDNSPNEDGFEVERQKKVGGSWGPVVKAGTVGSNTTQFTDSPGAGKYRYHVRAYNAFGNSAWSNWANVVVK